MQRGIIWVAVFIFLGFGVFGCGQEPSGGGGEEQSAAEASQTTSESTGESTSESTEETTGESTNAAGGSGFQGVVDSYGVAQAEIEAEGGEVEAGEYRVGYIVEPAEGWWEGDPPNLEWREPAAGETNHIEILPYDAETGLFVPYMDVELTVLDENGEEIENKPLFPYYAEFYHYADNFSLPESGTYTLRAELGPPDFRRHGDENGEGRVYENRVIAEFEEVEIDIEGE